MGRNMPAAGEKIKLVKISQGKTTKTAAAGKKIQLRPKCGIFGGKRVFFVVEGAFGPRGWGSLRPQGGA